MSPADSTSFGAVADQLMAAPGDRRMDRAGNREDPRPQSMASQAGGDQRPLFRAASTTSTPFAEPGDQPVAAGKLWASGAVPRGIR